MSIDLTPAIAAPKPKRVNGDLVQSLTRALELLEILAADGGCRLKELSQRAGLASSTTHRLLTTLEQKRFVRFDRSEGIWMVGGNCLAIGASYLRRRDLLSEAVPHLEGLATRLNATINLGVLDNQSLLLVKQAAGRSRTPAQPAGATLPLHATAMGKVLLAGAEDNAARSLWGGLKRLTDRTICDPAELAKELRSIRSDGVAVDDEESMAGRRCVAAPIRDEMGRCVAAISVTASRSQMTKSVFASLGNLLSATAGRITSSAGGHAGAIAS